MVRGRSGERTERDERVTKNVGQEAVTRDQGEEEQEVFGVEDNAGDLKSTVKEHFSKPVMRK
jgi:hypothetical protein